jgi:hypothetical protein
MVVSMAWSWRRSWVRELEQQILSGCRLKTPEIYSLSLNNSFELVMALVEQVRIRLRNPRLVTVSNSRIPHKPKPQVTPCDRSERSQDDLIEGIKTADDLYPLNRPAR